MTERMQQESDKKPRRSPINSSVDPNPTTDSVQASSSPLSLDPRLPRAMHQNAILHMQQLYGNQYVRRFLAERQEGMVQRDGGGGFPPHPGIGIPGLNLGPPLTETGKQGPNPEPPLAETGKQGPRATATELRALVEIRLESWRRAAELGALLFYQHQVVNKDEFDTIGFLETLIGNITWAAASFATGGTAFAISLVGVGDLTIASGRGKNTPDPSLAAIQDNLLAYINKIHTHLSTQVVGRCDNVINAFPGIGVNAALHRIMMASFKWEFLSIKETPPWKNEINETVVRDSMENFATNRLNHYRAEINPLITSDWSPDGPQIIRIKDLATLALAKHTVGDNWTIIEIISHEMHDTALRLGKRKWKRLGGWWEGSDENPLKTGALAVLSLGTRGPAEKWVEWTEEKPLPEVNSYQIWGGIPE